MASQMTVILIFTLQKGKRNTVKAYLMTLKAMKLIFVKFKFHLKCWKFLSNYTFPKIDTFCDDVQTLSKTPF